MQIRFRVALGSNQISFFQIVGREFGFKTLEFLAGYDLVLGSCKFKVNNLWTGGNNNKYQQDVEVTIKMGKMLLKSKIPRHREFSCRFYLRLCLVQLNFAETNLSKFIWTYMIRAYLVLFELIFVEKSVLNCLKTNLLAELI